MEHPENSEEYKGLVVNKGIEQPSSVMSFMELQVNMVMDMDKMRIKDSLVHGMY